MTFTVVLLSSLLAVATAPGSASPGAMLMAERASSSVVGPGETVVPDPLPRQDPSISHSGGSAATTSALSVVTTSNESPSAAQTPVASALASDGIPTVAMTAYRHAADLVNQRTAGCALPWTLLAAIGRVESDHGRFASSVLQANGLSTPRVIGVPLNGIGTGLILDTDNGVLDGDPVFDRAVGPMQFIPSTWAFYATDGNGDGVADPFNIFDAAAAAGKYLCKAGTNLGTRAGKVRAVLAYNHSNSYVAEVLALEATYAGTPVITEPSPVLALLHTSLPPVDPGVPPAIHPTVQRPASPAQTPPGPGRPSQVPAAPGLPPTLAEGAPAPIPSDPTPTPTATDPAPSPIPSDQTPAPTASDPTPTPTAIDPTPTPTATDPTPPPTPTETTPSPTPTSACTPIPPPPTDAPNGTLTVAQQTSLATIVEQQQLVHDLFLAFADRYKASVFTCMNNDEAWQLADTRSVLKVYSVADPTVTQPAGTFASAGTQQLYDTLLASGGASVDAALKAAAIAESTSITDLTAATTDVTAPDVLQLYANLLAASKAHLAAVSS
ncbi:MAG: DUF2202 domain-containing protein [Dermatophilaceae bacterium]